MPAPVLRTIPRHLKEALYGEELTTRRKKDATQRVDRPASQFLRRHDAGASSIQNAII
jgi:hypothetical protein